MLGTDRPPPLNEEQRAGIKAALVLANRDAGDFEQAAQSRLGARADAEAARDKAIIARYEQRLSESI
jgi:hypothetical protein